VQALQDLRPGSIIWLRKRASFPKPIGLLWGAAKKGDEFPGVMPQGKLFVGGKL